MNRAVSCVKSRQPAPEACAGAGKRGIGALGSKTAPGKTSEHHQFLINRLVNSNITSQDTLLHLVPAALLFVFVSFLYFLPH